jgi:hypothetical protein
MADFNFDTMSDVKETDQGEAIATTKFNFAEMEDMPVAPVQQRPSVISKFARSIIKLSPMERFKTSLYLQDKIPEVDPNDSPWDYERKIDAVLAPREAEIIGQGIGKVLETPMEGAIAVGAATAAVPTIIGLGAFSAIDKFFNLRRYVDEKFPETSPEVKDMVEIADFALKGAIIGKGMTEGNKILKKRMDALAIPRNVNISHDIVGGVKDSGNLTPEEKADIFKTLGIEQKHVDASVSGGTPINVPTSKVMELAEKPYWEIAKHELLGGAKGEAPLDLFGQPIESAPTKVSQAVIKDLQSLKAEKEISNNTFSRLKEFAGVNELKNSPEPLIKKLTSFIGDLKPEDKFLSDKQLVDLKDIIKELPNPEVTPKRIVLEKFGEKTEILKKGLSNFVDPGLVPTVNIKEGHPLVEKIVNRVSEKMIHAEAEINRRNEKLDEMVTAAEKSREPLLPFDEKLKRKIYPQNKEIFQALGGEKVELTKQEAAVIAYLRNFFEKAKRELALEKSRQKYVTHMEQPLTEKILNKGLFTAIKEIFKDPKKNDLPVDIMLELDNIIGSEKFFKYAMERKGGIEPTTNIREIINQYSHLYETKKALDEILPEGQAITKNLLQGKSAVWMKKYLQNLKGRGLDSNFRNGPMGWLTKTADAIVDYGYLKMLALNWKSAVKNIVAGEANAWIYQDFPTYLKGKERFISNPKRAYDLATEYGALEGTYSDFAQKGIGALKKYQDMAMIGQKVGEIEIRSSIFASMLSDKEWQSGEISPEHFLEIKDVIAKTQGVFSKWDSPLLLQTWYGRMFFQMNRWRITNISLMHEITIDAVKDIKSGNYKTQNVSRLGKALTAYGAGMYISYQLALAGYKTASDVTKNMAQTINGIFSLFSEGELSKMVSENPTFQDLKELSNTMQNTAKYLHVPGAKKSKGKGIEDTYIAPVDTTKDILESIEN